MEIEESTRIRVKYEVSGFYIGEAIPLEVCTDSPLLIEDGKNTHVLRPGCNFLKYEGDRTLDLTKLKV